MTTVKPGIITSRIQMGIPGRWSGVYANPVGRPARPTRATARTLNPKLNTTPWAQSYAVKRKSLPNKASKGVGTM
jgi:hypothetical protein